MFVNKHEGHDKMIFPYVSTAECLENLSQGLLGILKIIEGIVELFILLFMIISLPFILLSQSHENLYYRVLLGILSTFYHIAAGVFEVLQFAFIPVRLLVTAGDWLWYVFKTMLQGTPFDLNDQSMSKIKHIYHFPGIKYLSSLLIEPYTIRMFDTLSIQYHASVLTRVFHQLKSTEPIHWHAYTSPHALYEDIKKILQSFVMIIGGLIGLTLLPLYIASIFLTHCLTWDAQTIDNEYEFTQNIHLLIEAFYKSIIVFSLGISRLGVLLLIPFRLVSTLWKAVDQVMTWCHSPDPEITHHDPTDHERSAACQKQLLFDSKDRRQRALKPFEPDPTTPSDFIKMILDDGPESPRPGL